MSSGSRQRWRRAGIGCAAGFAVGFVFCYAPIGWGFTIKRHFSSPWTPPLINAIAYALIGAVIGWLVGEMPIRRTDERRSTEEDSPPDR